MPVSPPWVLALPLFLTAPPPSLRKREFVQPSGPVLEKWEPWTPEVNRDLYPASAQLRSQRSLPYVAVPSVLQFP